MLQRLSTPVTSTTAVACGGAAACNAKASRTAWTWRRVTPGTADRGFAQRCDRAERLQERGARLGADAGDAVELGLETEQLANFGAASIREAMGFVTLRGQRE
jgi:hypothetical protein